jgi:uncharacterized protein (DUF111 family)
MLYIDCREGLSGDMLLAGLLGLVPAERRSQIVRLMSQAAERRDVTLKVVDIQEGGETGLGVSYATKDSHHGETSYEEAYSSVDQLSKELQSTSPLPRKILDLIFEAEAEAHGVPTDRVHLHEIGRPAALLNIAAIGLVHSELVSEGVGEIVASAVTTGKGIVVVSHGAVRVPAPAARIILKGLVHSPGDDPGERATPSGIAAVKAMISHQSDEFPERYDAKSVGFGTKRFGGRLGRTTVIRTA